jgi:hypothetical protein
MLEGFVLRTRASALIPTTSLLITMFNKVPLYANFSLEITLLSPFEAQLSIPNQGHVKPWLHREACNILGDEV